LDIIFLPKDSLALVRAEQTMSKPKTQSLEIKVLEKKFLNKRKSMIYKNIVKFVVVLILKSF